MCAIVSGPPICPMFRGVCDLKPCDEFSNSSEVVLALGAAIHALVQFGDNHGAEDDILGLHLFHGLGNAR